MADVTHKHVVAAAVIAAAIGAGGPVAYQKTVDTAQAFLHPAPAPPSGKFVGFVFACPISVEGPCTRSTAQQVVQLPGPGFSNTRSTGLAGPPCILAAIKYGESLKLAEGMKFGVTCDLVKQP